MIEYPTETIDSLLDYGVPARIVTSRYSCPECNRDCVLDTDEDSLVCQCICGCKFVPDPIEDALECIAGGMHWDPRTEMWAEGALGDDYWLDDDWDDYDD